MKFLMKREFNRTRIHQDPFCIVTVVKVAVEEKQLIRIFEGKFLAVSKIRRLSRC